MKALLRKWLGTPEVKQPEGVRRFEGFEGNTPLTLIQLRNMIDAALLYGGKGTRDDYAVLLSVGGVTYPLRRQGVDLGDRSVLLGDEQSDLVIDRAPVKTDLRFDEYTERAMSSVLKELYDMSTVSQIHRDGYHAIVELARFYNWYAGSPRFADAHEEMPK